jgi:hypothetical protein
VPKIGALITKGIFGAPLKSATLCGSCNEYGLTVPDPVYRCFDEIMRRGIKEKVRVYTITIC